MHENYTNNYQEEEDEDEANEMTCSPAKMYSNRIEELVPKDEEKSQGYGQLTHLNSIAQSENIPLLFIDVNISPTETQRISIYKGDTSYQLASEFC